MKISDIYSRGQQKCLGCDTTIYAAPSQILEEHPHQHHLFFGACGNGHIYCDTCNKNFAKNNDAYPLCHCGEPLGSYFGLDRPPGQSIRFKNTDSTFYTLAQKSCFTCGKKFYTGSVASIGSLPQEKRAAFLACEGEHVICRDCHEQPSSGPPLLCGAGNCKLPLEIYYAAKDPADIGAKFLGETEQSDFTEVRYIISGTSGSIESADPQEDYTLYCADGASPSEVQTKMDQWLQTVAYRKGRRFMVVEKTLDGGRSFQKCTIPFSRVKNNPKENLDKDLASLDLHPDTGLRELHDKLSSSLTESAGPRLLSLSEKELFKVFEQLLDKAIETAKKLELERENWDNPILLVELAFEALKKWETAELFHLVNHDYVAAKYFEEERYLLPIFRYKCAYCCYQRQEYDLCLFYSRKAAEILHWHQPKNLEWLGYQVHKYQAVCHLERGDWQQALAAYQVALDHASFDQDRAAALYQISEIHRKNNKPDQAFTCIEKAKAYIVNCRDDGDDLKKLVDMSFHLLKLELSGREEDMQGLENFVSSFADHDQEMLPDGLHDLLENVTSNYGTWFRQGTLPQRNNLLVLKKKAENWLESLSEKEPEDRVNAIMTCLPVLGELKEDDLFQQHVEYGLYTAEKHGLSKKWLRLKRLGLRFQSLHQEKGVIEEYEKLMVRVEQEPDPTETLIFCSEYVEALVRVEGDNQVFFPLLDKMKTVYNLIRAAKPTIEGRTFFRATQQRVLEIAILACLTQASSAAGQSRELWLAELTDFLELAKGQSLYDYLRGFSGRELTCLSGEEQKEYSEKKANFYQTLEDMVDASEPLTRLQDFEIRMRAKYFKTSSPTHARSMSAQPRLPGSDDVLIVNYFFFKEYTAAQPGIAVLYYGSHTSFSIIPSEEHITSEVNQWQRRRFKVDAVAASLYHQLISAPLQELKIAYPELTPGIDTSLNSIGIIPDGILSDLPFEALVCKAAQKERMIQQKNIFYLHSLSSYASSAGEIQPCSWYGFGAPVHSYLKGPIQELLYSEQEIWTAYQSLAPHYHAEMFLGRSNRKKEFLALLNSIKPHAILHFSIHGLGDTDLPECSSLVFSTHDSKGAKIEAMLSFREILEMDLRGVELVVLNSCESASGKKLAGEGKQALSWAFKAAGVKHVIATRWPVVDASAALILSRFYHYLLKGGNICTSLRMAQLDFMHDHPEATAQHWSPYAIYL